MNQPSFDHDTHLIAVAQGDHKAFTALYQHEAPRMLALGKKMLVRSIDAQEAVKDTFILIWKHAESCDTSMTSARAWMYSIFRHRALNTMREPGRMPPAATTVTDHLPPQTSAHMHDNAFYDAIRQLEPAQRRALLMAYYHGHTYRQIAAYVGSSSETVQQQIRQGLRQLCRLNQP